MTPAQVAAIRLGEQPRAWVSTRMLIMGVDVAGAQVCSVPMLSGGRREMVLAYVWAARLAGLDPDAARRAVEAVLMRPALEYRP